MKTCGVCGRAVRKTQLANVAVGGGKLARKRVCSGCVFDKGILLVVSEAGARCACGAAATKCGACARPVLDDAMKKYVTVLKGRLRAYREFEPDAPPDSYAGGRIEALEGVVELLESGRW